MNDSEFIKAFVEAGLVGMLKEWADAGLRYRIAVTTDQVNGGECLTREWTRGKDDDPEWWADEHTDRDVANEILRQLQERCDEAGVDIVRKADGTFWVRKYITALVDGVWTDTGFDGHLLPSYFATRPEALIAANVAIQKEVVKGQDDEEA